MNAVGQAPKALSMSADAQSCCDSEPTLLAGSDCWALLPKSEIDATACILSCSAYALVSHGCPEMFWSNHKLTLCHH